MFSRLLTLLQFTRMALVFTAISDGWASMLLHARATGRPITGRYAVAMTLVSIGLYTFGMALNDLIDRRRDSQLAPGRPLPSGRISVPTAQIICTTLSLGSIAAGAWMVSIRPEQVLSLVLVIWTLCLITFYDFAGKYLVAPGLLTLGLVRFFQAAIAAPTLPIPWQPIVLLVHVTILSAVCYQLEGKRPRLTIKHWAMVVGGLVAIVGSLIGLLVVRRAKTIPWTHALGVTPALWYVLPAAVAFLLLGVLIVRRSRDVRSAGRSLMLYGLLWLIIYDASFVLGYVGWRQAMAILLLLPFSLVAVQVMRAWSRLVELSQRPQYQRAR